MPVLACLDVPCSLLSLPMTRLLCLASQRHADPGLAVLSLPCCASSLPSLPLVATSCLPDRVVLLPAGALSC